MELSEQDANYRAICSRLTLQSKKEGFFKKLADSLAPRVNFGVFILCSTDYERFKTVAAACWEHVNAELIFRGKNSEVAVEKRLEGNKYFEKNDYKKALLCYIQSLIQAPVGPELISAYNNRSALLFKLGDYQSAIDDAELAISYGSPEETKHKLYERMTSCYISLKNFQKAKVTVRLAKHLTEKHDPKNEKILKKIEKHGAAIEAGSKEATKTSTPKISQTDEALSLPDGISITNPSVTFTRASRKFTVDYAENQGRFAKATEKIDVGELVLCEEPYASCLNMEKSGSHCTHCFTRTKVPIPCETCSHVVFCSRKCRKDAMESYHRYECKVMALLMGSGMSPGAHLALRIITQGSVDQFKEMFMDLELDPTRVILDPDTGKFDHRSYFNIFNLTGLEEYRTHIDMYERTLMAVFLTKCLRLNEYFENLNLFKNPKPTEDELLIGSLILRNLQVIQFNAYEVCEFLMETSTNFRKTTTTSIGLAIYNTASYCNHACAPDVTRYFNGKTMIVQAIKGIQPDQPIHDNYGPLFTKMERKDRLRNLVGRYWFTCECIACQKNYPLLIQFPVEIVESENDLEERKALKKLINLDKLYFDEGVKAMESGKPLARVAIELFRQYIQEYEALTVLQEGKFANNPYKTVLLVQEGLKLCLCSLGSVHVTGEDK